jgi:putative sterol carrier protein
LIAHQGAVAGAAGRYLLEVGDGVGPITVVAHGDVLTVEKGAFGIPDVALYLSPDQWVRLVAGRFSLAGPVDAGAVRFEGDRDRFAGLNRIFGGIANG